MDLVVCRKGSKAAATFAENGGWESFPKMLDDLGIAQSECEDLWWETTEIAPPIPNSAVLPDSGFNWEVVKFAEVVHGRLDVVHIDSVIWGAHQEVRLINIDY